MGIAHPCHAAPEVALGPQDGEAACEGPCARDQRSAVGLTGVLCLLAGGAWVGGYRGFTGGPLPGALPALDQGIGAGGRHAIRGSEVIVPPLVEIPTHATDLARVGGGQGDVGGASFVVGNKQAKVGFKDDPGEVAEDLERASVQAQRELPPDTVHLQDNKS